VCERSYATAGCYSERHIRFEERELLPMIEQALPEGDLERLAAALARAEAGHE
jgi:hemerythrin-like domain-containing protein